MTYQGRAATEAAATGLAYSAALCWASTCLVASFRPSILVSPYWSAIPVLRTDTTGVIAFVATAASLWASRFLRYRRIQLDGAKFDLSLPPNPRILGLLATSETAAVLLTVVFVYLSINAVSHPPTLSMRLTHLAPWPTEDTTRACALIVLAAAAAASQYLRISLRGPETPRTFKRQQVE